MSEFDVVVVGKGNAALCAAIAARETSARVAILEAAPEDESGGNTRFAGGMMRFAYDSVDDLRLLVEITDEEAANTDWETNTTDQFYDDLFRATKFRTDPRLSEILVTKSMEAMLWLRSQGVRFVPNYRAGSAVVAGKRKFFGRVPIQVSGGGAGLVLSLTERALKKGIQIFYATRAVSLIYDGGRVLGVTAKAHGEQVQFPSRAVVLACGGFEANPEWRTRYLGPGWELAKVRGTRFNMGEGLRMALDIGASSHGNWSGRHAISWDRYSPEFGDFALDRTFQRQSFPLSLMINAHGERFLDEGADFYTFTYAKYGPEVFKQPDQFAWQIFDGTVTPLLRPEYNGKAVTRVSANTLEDLAMKLEGVDGEGFLKTVRAYNAAIRRDVEFNPSIKDGKHTVGISPPKSNWAVPLETPPFVAYHVTCGITFTFGGLRIDPETAQVLDVSLEPIPGLYTAGEMVGGLFYFNYPLGTGLVGGTIFGRIAGAAAGALAHAESTVS